MRAITGFRQDDEGDWVDVEVAARSDQPLPPGIAHHIELSPPARVAVEFWGRPARPDDA
jgi:hypothetical protein